MKPRPTRTAVYLLATQLDEQVATLHFPAFGAVCTGSTGFIVLEYPCTKIRAESSSNGSELRSAGFTPHKIRAERSSNPSSRPASDKKSELRGHQMAPGGRASDNLPVSTRTRAHGRWQLMSLMKDFLLVPSVSVIAMDGSA